MYATLQNRFVNVIDVPNNLILRYVQSIAELQEFIKSGFMIIGLFFYYLFCTKF